MAQAAQPQAQAEEIPPLRTREAYDRAVAEAAALLEAEPKAGSREEARFHALLRQIAEFHPYGDPTPELPGSELDRRLREAAHDHHDETTPPTDPWKPMIGGDLRRPSS